MTASITYMRIVWLGIIVDPVYIVDQGENGEKNPFSFWRKLQMVSMTLHERNELKKKSK